MSLRYLYRRVPKGKRICRGCGKPIIRNIAVHQGELWHYGCLQEAKMRKYRCLNCHSILNTLQVNETIIMGKPMKSCGFCGSTNIQSLHSWTSQSANILYTKEASGPERV